MKKSSLAGWSQSILAAAGNPPSEMSDSVAIACMKHA